MAIWPNYTTFRHHFSVSGTPDPITGYEEWPLNKVRTGGFTTLNVPRPITQANFTVTCNGVGSALIGADDAVLGVHEYNWYVSLRTDDPASQIITATQYSAAKSGTLQFGVNTTLAAKLLNVTSFTGTTKITSDLTLQLLYRNVWIYVQRVSDDAVQLVDLLRASTADY